MSDVDPAAKGDSERSPRRPLDQPAFLHDDEEDIGGPVKSFVEHLEDLRWVLIKCVATLLVGMVICLAAGEELVNLLRRPLDIAQEQLRPRHPTLLIGVGGNLIWRVPLQTNRLGGLDLGTNRYVALGLTPALEGTNWLLTLQPVAEAPLVAAAQTKEGVVLNVFGPARTFTLAIDLAIYGGIAVTSPFLLYVLLQYLVPALRPIEKRYLGRGLVIGGALFFAGAAFCYFLLLRAALYTTVAFSRWLTFTSDEWRAEQYLGFVAKLMLAAGLAFELPVVLLTLVKIGVLDYPKLKKWRAFAVIGNLILAALITPWGDPFTMVLIALPLQALYEFTVIIAGFWHRRAAK
jgi:sec-independent protein translocase protein TatC